MFHNLKRNKKRKNRDHKECKLNPTKKLAKFNTNCEIPLPDVILRHTFFGYLEPDDAKKLAIVSPSFSNACQKQLTTFLLQHVAYGEQDEAENMLKTNPDLLLCKGDVTDYSNRTFHNITAFQYALWALDQHMWKMLRKYLSKDKQKSQLDEWEEKGVTYSKPALGDQKKEVIIEKHYDFSLIAALQDYVINFNARDHYQLNAAWCKNVGGAQKNIPAHVAQEYCFYGRSFDPTPEFKEHSLPRVDVFYISIYNDLNSKSSWFSADSGLQSKWAIVRMASEEAFATIFGAPCAPAVVMDLKAVTALFEMRTKQLEHLKEEFLTQAVAHCSFRRGN